MKHLTRLGPSPAMVVACLALGIALGGTSYAAIKLPRNSVGTKQLKKNAVTSPKVKNNAITGADVNEASLGQVPSATNATNATHATTAGSAAPSGAAGGDLTGTYPAPSIAGNAVTSAKVIDASQVAGLRRADIAAVSTTVNFDPPNIGAQSCIGVSATVTGAQTGDIIIAHPVNPVWGQLIYAPWTAVPNLVYLRICNPTGGAVDGSAKAFQVLLIR
jgi:hypothetical protein